MAEIFFPFFFVFFFLFFLKKKIKLGGHVITDSMATYARCQIFIHLCRLSLSQLMVN
jgi:hypothetical protein